MTIDKDKIKAQAIKAIKDKNLVIISDVIAYLPICKTTFYSIFKVGQEDYTELMDLIEYNRVETKVALKNDWKKSKAPILQISLFKLIATPEELSRLSMNTHNIIPDGEQKQINLDAIPTEILEEILRANNE